MNERKVVYLDDALEAIRKLPNAGMHWFVSAEAVFDALLKLAPAQPEIIRCKNCKYWRQETNNQGAPLSHGLCENDAMWRSSFYYRETCTDADFCCGYAERRTDE
jgi:hypothetical protein